MRALRTREVAGTAVSITTYDEVLDWIDSAVDEGARTYVCFTPASSLVAARRDTELRAALSGAGIVAPDGMGVVYAARILGESIGDRVYGPDLMRAQLARAAAAGTPIYLYGGHDAQALATLKIALAREYPGLNVVGAESPPHRAPSDAERSATIGAINASGAKIVWIGLGSPKQEVWMWRMRSELDAPVLLGVGAAFDFIAGRVEQAPLWMQRHGLEWLHRITRDPVRLGRRYLTTLPAFAALVLRQRMAERQCRAR